MVRVGNEPRVNLRVKARPLYGNTAMMRPITVVLAGKGVLCVQKTEITQAVEAHADDVLRACSVYLREKADREDAFQETFLRFARSATDFVDDEHRKAWLIRVAINICKDMLKSARARVESLEAKTDEGFAAVGDDGQKGQRDLEREGLFAALARLDDKYRIVLYLKYYESYTAAQISQVTGMPENTVYTNLARGKRKLLGMINHD